MKQRPRLLFVSTRFLFPVDSGGKTRSTQILRGMKDGGFEIILASPAAPGQSREHGPSLARLCDRFEGWPAPRRHGLSHLSRLRHLAGPLPVAVRTDLQAPGRELTKRLLTESVDVVVFDFVHAAVLAPDRIGVPSLLFTHNVEADLLDRNAGLAANPLARWVWRNQQRKMHSFEERSLGRFDTVVAVSARDRKLFASRYGRADAVVLPTGVDLEFFNYEPPRREGRVTFLGSMDWHPNQDAMRWFMDGIWPRIRERVPAARMKVVGRAPSVGLRRRAEKRRFDWEFTGFVEDVRPDFHGSAVTVIPLRLGGGTRLKVFEAMAMGTPVVSTALGVEGLDLRAGHHYLEADDEGEIAAAVVLLLEDENRRLELSLNAREYVEQHASDRRAAQVFEAACSRLVRAGC